MRFNPGAVHLCRMAGCLEACKDLLDGCDRGSESPTGGVTFQSIIPNIADSQRQWRFMPSIRKHTALQLSNFQSLKLLGTCPAGRHCDSPFKLQSLLSVCSALLTCFVLCPVFLTLACLLYLLALSGTSDSLHHPTSVKIVFVQCPQTTNQQTWFYHLLSILI